MSGDVDADRYLSNDGERVFGGTIDIVRLKDGFINC